MYSWTHIPAVAAQGTGSDSNTRSNASASRLLVLSCWFLGGSEALELGGFGDVWNSKKWALVLTLLPDSDLRPEV